MCINVSRFAIAFLVTLLGIAELSIAQTQQAVMPKNYTKLFHRYCFECHDSDSQEGGVDLETLPLQISRDIQTAERWSDVLDAINSGEMPPQDSKQISDREKLYFLDKLSNQMVLARKVLNDSGGEITLRRLNRREYANSVEELLGLKPDVETLPDDRTGAGFDTEGASLYVSSDLLELYYEVASKALAITLGKTRSGKYKVVRVEPEKHYTKGYTNYAKTLQTRLRNANAYFAQAKNKNAKPPSAFDCQDEYEAKKYRQQSKEWLPQLEEYLARPETKTGVALIMTIKGGGMTQIKLPKLHSGHEGEYKIRVRAAAYKDAPARLQYLEFNSFTGGTQRTRLGWRKVNGTLKNPEIIEFPITHPRGKTLNYVVHQRTHQDRGDKNLWTLKQRENGLGMPPGVWVDWAEIVPVKRKSTVKRDEILFKRPESWKEEKYAKEVLERFAVRAFRGHSPNADYLKRLFAMFSEGRSRGQDFVEAIRKPLAVILSSPSFIYMAEPIDKDDSKALGDRELAVRLAYFLWSCPPDQQLLKLAAKGTLSDPNVLRAQTKRLLEDPRADNFIRSFTYQWLEMERVDMFQFSGTRFPTFDNAVRENAREELFQMVGLLLKDDLPLSEMLSDEFVVVNDVMADFYGLPPVQGHHFTRVKRPRNSIRGGILGTAAIHCMGSDGVRSSPVERGAWVLRHLINDPPPPAPPNVPQLSRLDGEPLSGRQLQKAHQEQPQCAQCHRKIDPIGFALENFDASGLWREVELISYVPKTKKKRKKTVTKEFAVDARGELPSGEKFNGFQQLRSVVAKRADDFAMGFTESLIAYGLGRPFAFTDEQLAEDIVAEAKAENYRFTEFIHALVQSEVFNSR